MIEKLRFIFDRKQKIFLLILSVMIFIGAAMELMGISVILPVADVMLNPDIMQTNKLYLVISRAFGITDVRSFIILLCSLIILVYIIKNSYLSFLYYVQTRFTQDNSMRMSTDLLNSYLHREYLFHTEHNVSEMQRNIIKDVEGFYVLVETVIQLAIEIVTSIALLAYIFFTDFQTALMMTVLIGIPVAVCAWYFKKKLYKVGQASREYNVISTKWLLQALGGVKEIKATNREDFFGENFFFARKNEIAMQRKSMMIKKVPRYAVEVCCIGGMMIIVILKIVSGTDLALFANTLVIIALSAVRLMPAFNRITEYIGIIMYRMPSLDGIYRDVCMIRKKHEKGEITNERLVVNQVIDIKDIAFRYPNGKNDVFSGVNMTIKKNTSVALIGSSGAGKTTLVDLLLGLLVPDEGEIRADDANIFCNLARWRNSISYIPQSIYLTDDSIRNNVAFGQAESEIDDARVWNALRLASLEEFVRGLSDGIDTVVGDRGVRLSGGQRQRIGIARALYREPEVLLMDEATSSLDQETEQAIMESIDNLHGAITIIIIAHRLTTIQNCDVIYEIKDGRVFERDKKDIWGKMGVNEKK